MPTKTKRYSSVKFTPTAIREAAAFLSRLDREAWHVAWPQEARDKYGIGEIDPQDRHHLSDAQVSSGDEDWTFDSFDEFLSAYRDGRTTHARIRLGYGYVGSVSLEFLGALQAFR